MSKNKLKDLMLLDDWRSTIGPIAIEMLTKYGRPVIDKLWDKFMGKV